MDKLEVSTLCEPPRPAPRNLPQHPKCVLTSFYGVVGEGSLHATLLEHPEPWARTGDKISNQLLDPCDDAVFTIQAFWCAHIDRSQRSLQEDWSREREREREAVPIVQVTPRITGLSEHIGASLERRQACPSALVTMSQWVSASKGPGMTTASCM